LRSIDGYDNERGGGFRRPLSKADAITYVRKLSREAKRYGMSTGLKNAADVIKSLHDDIHFAVNEECAQLGECDVYQNFVAPKDNRVPKPVFHIEYVSRRPTMGRTTGGITTAAAQGAAMIAESAEIFTPRWPNATAPQIRQKMCLRGSGLGSRLSTVIKEISLGGWVMYCDGSVATTRVGTGGHEAAFIPGRGGKRYRVVQEDVSETDLEEDPEHTASAWTAKDPDIAKIFFGPDPAPEDQSQCCDDVWEEDVGPIREEDLKPDPLITHKGAAKDRIGPNGPVQASESRGQLRRVKL
jgi:hypothetical protein